MSTARQYIQDPLVSQAVPGPFSLAEPDVFKKSLLKAGFIDIQSETINVTFEFDSAEDYEIQSGYCCAYSNTIS
jgi:hypothetical protein